MLKIVAQKMANALCMTDGLLAEANRPVNLFRIVFARLIVEG
jgi:hypothetical protein